MSNELKILKLFCSSRKEFNKGESYLAEIKNLEREIKVVLSLIKRYYNSYETAISISHEDLRAYYDLLYPNSKEREVYLEIIGEVFRSDVSSDVVKDLVEHVIEQHYAAQIMFKLMPIVEGNARGRLLSVSDDLSAYASMLRSPPKKNRNLIPYKESLQTLVDDDLAGGIPWFLPRLTEIIGGDKCGTLGLIFAPVDVGKTSMGLRSCAGFAEKLGEKELIVYAGNEESGKKLSLRMAQAMLGKTKKEIAANVQASEEELITRGYNRILLFDSINHISQVETLLSEVHPRILFIDQGTKVKTDHQGTNEVGEAQFLFNWYRERAKLYDTSIIALAQASGESDNKKWLRLSDIYGSRVAIQGELDYAIGIGRTLDDVAYAEHRFFNICKNKNDAGKQRFQTLFSAPTVNFVEV